MRTTLTLLLCLILAACNQAQRANSNKVADAAPSRFVRPEFNSVFRTIAPASYLGGAWEENGAADGVRAIWADASGNRSLVLLRGAGYPALWLNRDASLLAEPVQFDHEPLYVNTTTAVAYAAEGGALLTRSLPDGEWETSFGADGSGTIFAVSGHAQSESVWLVYEDTQRAAAAAAETDVDAIADVDLTPGSDAPLVKEVHGDPDKLLRTLTAVRLTGGDSRVIELPSGDADAPVQVAALKDGRAYAAVGGDVFLLDPDSGMTVAQQVYSTDREVLVAADIAQPVGWVYAEPRGASSGTGRSDEAAVAGEVVAFDNAGNELARQEAGLIHFSQLAGDWTSQRALLARSGAGVLSVEFAARTTQWALRDGGEVPLHLVADGAQLWALLPDGISGIAANRLLKLAPTLAAAQVLSRQEIQPLRAAVEALGWDWKRTLISPLSPHTGRITLFNAADPASELAELDWSPSRKHVSRLLAARPALDGDREFAALSPAEQQARMTELLSALGWPEAKVDELRSVRGEGEVTYTYTLKQDCPEGCAPGEFGLWQGENVLLTLDAATAELPADALAIKEAERIALAAVTSAELPAPQVQVVRAGWVVTGRDELLPEAEGEAAPAYEVHAEADGEDDCEQYRVLVHARSGELLAQHVSKCGPLR